MVTGKLSCFCLLLTVDTLTSVFKEKSLKSHKTVKIKVFLKFFLLVDGMIRSRIQIRIKIRTNNYGSGFWRPKNLRIWIRILNAGLLTSFYFPFPFYLASFEENTENFIRSLQLDHRGK
jgi:hypothetical protein